MCILRYWKLISRVKFSLQTRCKKVKLIKRGGWRGGGEKGILTEVYRIRYIYIHTHERINNFVMYRSNHSYRWSTDVKYDLSVNFFPDCAKKNSRFEKLRPLVEDAAAARKPIKTEYLHCTTLHYCKMRIFCSFISLFFFSFFFKRGFGIW